MRRLRLHTKFIVLLTSVSLIPLVIVAGVTLIRFQQSLQLEAEKLGHQLASTAAAEIRTFMATQFAQLDNIASMYHPDFPIEREVAEQLLEVILLRSENLMDVSIVNSEGQEITRKNRLLVITPEDLRQVTGTPAFEAVKETGAYVGPVYVRSGRPFFDFGRRIPDSQGQFAGAVFAQVDARVMPKVVAEISNIVDKPGRIYIVNERGVVIAHPDLSYVLAERDLSALPSVRRVVNDPEHSSNVAESYVNENGDSVLGSTHTLTIELLDLRTEMPARLNWYVVAEQPAASVYGDARRTAWFSLVLSLVAVLSAAGAAVFFAGRISRPIEELHMATVEFGRGNLGYRTTVHSNDEIGDLAVSFNTTADKLSKTVASLQAEEQVTSAERNKLRLILAGITNAVIAVDLERRIVLFNRAAETLTKRRVDEVIGKPIEEVISLYDAKSAISTDTYCPKNTKEPDGVVYSGNDLRIEDSSGIEHIVNVVSGRIREGQSIQLGCVITLEDITRESVMERTKREFVSIAAHQLRTPLTGMSWTVEMLLSGAKGVLNAGQKELVERGLDAIHRMVELVNDLLDVSRIEEGLFGIKTAQKMLAPIFDRILANLKKQADRRAIVLDIQIDPNLPPLEIDEDKLEFAISNLVDNAIKYTPERGRVEVRARVENSAVVISIKDSGIGIPDAEHDRVFTKFFRSRRAKALHTDGSGLGLYVAKNIVEHHGGKISFDSKEGQGTTFRIAIATAKR
ncbi:MAG TPA: ATP-binding protein [Candidatus Paceibacterota bacterium]